MRIHVTALALVAVGALAAASGPAAASQSLGFNNARQLVATGGDTFALVLVDGTRVVLEERRFGSPSPASRTTVASASGVSQPAIARRRDSLVVAWVENGVVRVRIRESGRWLATETLGPGAAPSLAATASTVGAVWHRADGSAVLFSRWLGGATWSRSDELATGGAEDVSFASLAGSGNRFVAAWKRGAAGGATGVELAISEDGGRAWSRAQSLGEGADPAVCLAGGNELWLGYQHRGDVVVAVSRDRGRTLSRTTVGEGWFAHLSCRRGATLVAWEKTSFPPFHPDPSVKGFGLAQVEASGRVSAERSPADRSVAAPTVLAAGSKRAYAWIDTAGSDAPLRGTLRIETRA